MGAPSMSFDLPVNALDDVARFAVERMDTALWLYEFEESRIVWANPAALKLWNAASVQELAERQFREAMSQSVADRLTQYREDFGADAEGEFLETWTLYPGDVPILVDCKLRWCPLADGRACTLVEASPKSSDEPATLRSLDALVHSEVMTALYSMSGEELYANRAQRQAFGSGARAFGSCFADPDARDDFMKQLTRQGKHRATVACQTQGGERWYDLQAMTCRDVATGAAAFHVSATDVTETHAYEQELKTARDNAVAAERARSEFVASMSHEMRTPMNGILGMVELLSNSPLNERQRKQVKVLRDSGRALLSLIEDVLDLSSMELKATKIRRGSFDPHELVRSVVEGLKPPAQNKGLILDYEINHKVPRTAWGDSPRLAQLMRNLIGNAIKFTPRGSITLRVARHGPRRTAHRGHRYRARRAGRDAREDLRKVLSGGPPARSDQWCRSRSLHLP